MLCQTIELTKDLEKCPPTYCPSGTHISQLFAKVISIRKLLFPYETKIQLFSKCFNIRLRTFGSSEQTICRRTFFQVFRQFNRLAEHKSRYIININRRMPNCTSVVQTASDLFKPEIRPNLPKK